MFSCQKHFSRKIYQNDIQRTKKLKRASFSASEKGAMTLEASLVLPLFLIVLFMLVSAGEILMIHGQVGHGIKEAACQIAINEYAALKRGKEVSIVSNATAKAVFLSSVNKKFLDKSSLAGGSAGVLITGESAMNSKGEYMLTARYYIRKRMPFLPGFTGTFTQKIRQKAMTGYVPDGDERSEGTVYITPYESVYHTDLNCTHLALDISVDEDVEKYLKGETSYKECEKCTKYHQGDVSCLYIPKEGEAYHTDLTCSGLKRTVKQVDKSTLKGVKPCQRCGRKTGI